MLFRLRRDVCEPSPAGSTGRQGVERATFCESCSVCMSSLSFFAARISPNSASALVCLSFSCRTDCAKTWRRTFARRLSLLRHASVFQREKYSLARTSRRANSEMNYVSRPMASAIAARYINTYLQRYLPFHFRTLSLHPSE